MSGRLTILNYHNVEQPPVGAALPKLYVQPADFARQMRWLKRLGLRGVSLGEGLWHLRRGRAGRLVAITFDDGYTDNLHHAAPILSELGFGATCFVVTGCLGQHNVWDAANLRVRKPLMSAQELKAWLDYGFELGSHTRTHPRLDQLPVSVAEEEIAGSRHDLEQLTGVRAEHFCYPYGCLTDAVVEQVAAAGYQSAVTTRRGLARADEHSLLLPRVSVSGRRGLVRFLLKAGTPYGAWRSLKRAA